MRERFDPQALCVAPSPSSEAMFARLNSLLEKGGEVKLGVMGGTFDPVHTGHLACAQMALDACGLDGVLFMVAPRPWMKQGQDIADAEARVDMCRLATEGNASFAVSSMEVRRDGKTYTSDTLRALREALPDAASLSFIIGADTLKTLPGWHEADELARLATFVCVSRPGGSGCKELLARAQKKGFAIRWVDAPLLDISSSEVRNRLAQGETVRYLVPDPVLEYIEAHALYGGAHHA